VKDNGVGYPEAFDYENSETLGLEIVLTFARQLRGTFEYQNLNGTFCKITFPKLE